MRRIILIGIIAVMTFTSAGFTACGGAYYGRHIAVSGTVVDPGYGYNPGYNVPVQSGCYWRQAVDPLVCGPFGCYRQYGVRIIQIPCYGY